MKKLSRVEKKMKRRRIFFKLILLTILISSIVVLALNTNLFIIDNIKVLGNNKISKDIIIKSSSISIGENIFKISIKTGKENLETLAYVKEASIKRKFPKGIIIEVIERKEIVQIKHISSFVYIDNQGYILDIIDNVNEDLPLLIGLNVEYNKIGENIFVSEEFSPNMEFIYEGHAIGLLQKMKEINMSDNNNVDIVLIDGITIAFGTLDNVKYKISLLNEVLKDIYKNKIQCKMILMNKGENPIIVTNDVEGG